MRIVDYDLRTALGDTGQGGVDYGVNRLTDMRTVAPPQMFCILIKRSGVLSRSILAFVDARMQMRETRARSSQIGIPKIIFKLYT